MRFGDECLPKRFWDKATVVNDCWIFTGSTNRGYGAVRFGGKRGYLHRLAFVILYGDLPPKTELDHLCRQRACFNPAHLEPVSHSTNIRRGTLPNKNKTHCANGHEYTKENTYVWTNGHRSCRKCGAVRARRYRKCKHKS